LYCKESVSSRLHYSCTTKSPAVAKKRQPYLRYGDLALKIAAKLLKMETSHLTW